MDNLSLGYRCPPLPCLPGGQRGSCPPNRMRGPSVSGPSRWAAHALVRPGSRPGLQSASARLAAVRDSQLSGPRVWPVIAVSVSPAPGVVSLLVRHRTAWAWRLQRWNRGKTPSRAYVLSFIQPTCPEHLTTYLSSTYLWAPTSPCA